MGQAAVQDQVVAAVAGKSDEQLHPIRRVGGDGAEQSGARHLGIADSAAEHRTD